MSKKTIKFSHEYWKMPIDYSPSQLIAVIPINLEDLSSQFIEYDTRIRGGGHYNLPKKGRYLLLLLITKSGQLWTTIRKWHVQKEAYYTDNIGLLFEIVISGGN